MNIPFLSVASDTTGKPYELLLLLGLILILAKLFSLLFTKLKMPQVIGFLVSGLVIGLITLIPGQHIISEYTETGLDFFSKVGVVLIMFSAGLETDLKKVKSMGVSSLIITSLGVLIPVVFGFILSFVFDNITNGALEMKSEDGTLLVPRIYTELFYGVILSATSVSITVATLKELKKLDTPIGTSLISAAIIDDVIGIILLSLIISLASAGTAEPDTATFAGMIMQATGSTSTALSILLIIGFMVLFFVLTFVLGHFAKLLFNYLGTKYPHHIRITILALGICFIWAYLAEFFSIADITGAYLMGLMLATSKPEHYIDHRSETIADNIFAPVFFAGIALSMYDGSSFDSRFIIFGIFWVFLGMLGKVIGAGSGALICKFKFKDSLKVGVGMMARAEVVIVCAQKGVDSGLIDSQIMVYTLALILISSFLTPIMLKLLYKGEAETELIRTPDKQEEANQQVTSGE